MSTPARTALSGQQFLTKTSMTSMPHLPYSPNLATSDLSPPQMKKVLKGKCFADVEEVKPKMVEALKGIKIGDFKNHFKQWENVLIDVLHQTESTSKGTEV